MTLPKPLALDHLDLRVVPEPLAEPCLEPLLQPRGALGRVEA